MHSATPTPPASSPMVAVIDRDRLTAYGMALLLRDWGYDSVVGVSAAEIFGRSEGAGRPLAAIVADDRGPQSGDAEGGGRNEAAALARLARRAIPTIVFVSAMLTDNIDSPGAARVLSLPKPVEPNMLRELLLHVTAIGAAHEMESIA